jgi:hypothetical protein
MRVENKNALNEDQPRIAKEWRMTYPSGRRKKRWREAGI